MKNSTRNKPNILVSTVFALTALSLGVTGSYAADSDRDELSLDIIRKVDFNKDGKICQGEESQALSAFFDDLNSYQKSKYYLLEVNEDEGVCVDVSEFQEKAWYEQLSNECDPHQRVFLRDKVVDISLLQPGLQKAGGEQATFSITQNNLDDTWTWNVNGAVTVVAFWDDCLHTGAWTPDQMVLAGFALAPAVAFNGSGQTGQEGKSSLQFGLNSEMKLLGGVFDYQQINVMPYYQTDFDFEAQAYGLKASWYPVLNSAHLGGYVDAPNAFIYWWSLRATADFLSVQDAGQTNFVDGTEYGWLGAELGGHVMYRINDKGPTVFADVTYDLRQDVINNVNANLFTAKAGVYLDPEKRTSLILSYQNGVLIDTLSDVDKTTLAFGLKF